MYYARLETNPGLPWVNAVSNMFESDQVSESYAFLGQSPAMREWIGGRQAKGLRSNDPVIITNRHFEGTLEVAVRDARRDKTAQIRARIEDLADRAVSHWASLLSTLILNGASTACYDGQYYFDTDHAEGDSGSQSNSISVDISAVPGAGTDNTPAAPNLTQMQWAMLQGITTLLGFKDDRGEPMNENARAFTVLVPTNLYLAAQAAVSTLNTMALAQNFNPAVLPSMQIDVQMNPRLSSWTDKFAVFRNDSPVKGLIRQSETGVEMKAKAEGSEFEFDHDAWQFGIDSWRNVGYGYWQRACLVTMV
jgi:phage major head subunit gpT-like protein